MEGEGPIYTVQREIQPSQENPLRKICLKRFVT
jgi:hypothetical protein